MTALAKAMNGVRLLAGMVRARPIHCIVQVSNRCNLTCGFCSFWERPAERGHELTPDDFRTISSKLAEAGSLIVSLEGGEPLLRSDIFEIVRAFARWHHPILFTNGWTVTEEKARALWDAGLDTVGVSIDYPTDERHDAHRGRPGTLAAAKRAVELLRDTAPLGSKQVFVMTVLMESNAAEMRALLELSAALRVGHQVTLLSTDGGGRATADHTRPRAGVGEQLLALKREHPHFITFSGYLEGVDRFLRGDVRTPCWAGERFFNVDHLGDVSPCIEKLHLHAGNLARDPWAVVSGRLAAIGETKHCRDCYTSCRGFVEEMSGAPKLRSYREFFGDFAKGAT